MTPAAAMASMKTAVSCRSVTPGTNAAAAAANDCSATRTEARMASIFVGALDPADLAEHRLAVDELGRRERLGQQVGRRTRHGVSGDPAGRRRALHLRQHLHEVHGVEGDAVQVLVGDLLGNPLVPRAQEVDRPALAHEHAARSEGPGTRRPQSRRARDVAGVPLAPDNEEIDVGLLHGGQHAGAAGQSERSFVGEYLNGGHRLPQKGS